jgi:hypothetical protein
VPLSAFCAEPGCPGIAKTGKFCDAHTADNYLKRKNAARPERDSWYGRGAWRGPFGAKGYKLRHDPICEKPGCTRPATDVHHKNDEWKTTGDWRAFIDQNNLESLCHEHHSEETMKRNQNRGLLCNTA